MSPTDAPVRGGGPPRPFGLVLAGGAGRRLGGDKPARILAGRPLLAHACARLAPQVARLAVAVGPATGRFAGRLPPDAVPVADPAGAGGPLAGLAAGLGWLAETAPGEEAALLVVPVDMPFLPADLANRLGRVSPAAPVAVARSGEGVSPVVAMVHPAVRAALDRLLADDPAPPVRRLLAAVPVRVVDVAADPPFAARGVDPLFNVNTPEDLARAEAVLRGDASA